MLDTQQGRPLTIAIPCGTNAGARPRLLNDSPDRRSVWSQGCEDGVTTGRIVRERISRADLARLAEEQFGDWIKAVVDVSRGTMAVGGDLHADDEATLLADGSRQRDLWGINLYPGESGSDWIEFDSMINLRPSQGNRSRGVDDEQIRARIREVVGSLVP